MATLTIRKADGSQAGSLEVKDDVFGVDPNPHCVQAAVSQYLANQRAGTHCTKTRAYVSGGGRKPWKQKGTGRARQGSTRAVQWRGGAISFGPLPRDYTMRLNKKVKAQAFRSVWSQLIQDGRLVVVQSFGMVEPKTRQMTGLLKTLGVDGSALVVSEKTDEAMALSARNLPYVTSLNADNLNIYDLLIHDWVVVTPEVIKHVEAIYA